MTRLSQSLAAWGTDDFKAELKREIAALGIEGLPLQEGLTKSSYVVDRDIQVIILGVTTEHDAIQVRAGVFYSGIIAGCSCADDPTPVDEENEYCELELLIDRDSADTEIHLQA